jgi:hypothetical protein
VNKLYKENYKLLKREIEEDYRRWNSYHQKHHHQQALVRTWRKRKPCTLLVGMKAGATTLVKNLETP